MNAPTKFAVPVSETAPRRRLDKARPFRLPTDPARGEVVVVLAGLLGLYKTDARGRVAVVGVRFPGEAVYPEERPGLGLWPLVRNTDLAIESDEVVGFLKPKSLARSARIAYQSLALLRASAETRISHFLCEFAARGRHGTEKIPNPLTQAQIGDVTGQTSVNVNRIFAKLEADGLIERSKKHIHFKDWSRLAELAEFQPDYLNEEASK